MGLVGLWAFGCFRWLLPFCSTRRYEDYKRAICPYPTSIVPRPFSRIAPALAVRLPPVSVGRISPHAFTNVTAFVLLRIHFVSLSRKTACPRSPRGCWDSGVGRVETRRLVSTTFSFLSLPCRMSNLPNVHPAVNTTFQRTHIMFIFAPRCPPPLPRRPTSLYRRSYHLDHQTLPPPANTANTPAVPNSKSNRLPATWKKVVDVFTTSRPSSSAGTGTSGGKSVSPST